MSYVMTTVINDDVKCLILLRHLMQEIIIALITDQYFPPATFKLLALGIDIDSIDHCIRKKLFPHSEGPIRLDANF